MMGKKQISELNFFDYVVGITIGSIAADISLDIEKNMIAGIAALFIYGFISYIISFVSIKSIWARRFFIGVPTVLVEKGKIIESGLKKSKIDVNDLLMEARENGYFNLDEIDYALMEVNGNRDKLHIKKFISIMPMKDSAFFREYLRRIEPGLDLSYDFDCPNCGHVDSRDMPVTPKLFYPDLES